MAASFSAPLDSDWTNPQWTSTWSSLTNLDTSAPSRVTVNGQTHPPPSTARNHFGSSQSPPPPTAMHVNTVPSSNALSSSQLALHGLWGDPCSATYDARRNFNGSWSPVQPTSQVMIKDPWDVAQHGLEPKFKDPWASAQECPPKFAPDLRAPFVTKTSVRKFKNLNAPTTRLS